MGASDDEYTYDRALADGGPYVPDVDDLGGDDIADNPQDAPQRDGTEPYDGLYNERGRNLAGVNRCIWWCTLWLEWDGAAWSIANIDSMGTLVEAGDFTLTPGVAGELKIEWDGGTLPPMARKPRVWATDSFGRGWGEVMAANEIDVHLHNEAGSGANFHFAVELR